MEDINQDKAIFMGKCSALAHKNNEILVYILPLQRGSYLFVVPKIPKIGIPSAASIPVLLL